MNSTLVEFLCVETEDPGSSMAYSCLVEGDASPLEKAVNVLAEYTSITLDAEVDEEDGFTKARVVLRDQFKKAVGISKWPKEPAVKRPKTEAADATGATPKVFTLTELDESLLKSGVEMYDGGVRRRPADVTKTLVCVYSRMPDE
jgi:hypothetical protein